MTRKLVINLFLITFLSTSGFMISSNYKCSVMNVKKKYFHNDVAYLRFDVHFFSKCRNETPISRLLCKLISFLEVTDKLSFVLGLSRHE